MQKKTDPTMPEDIKSFICSFCEQLIRYRTEQHGRRGKCPKCSKPVILVSNQSQVVDDQLTSSWYYQRLRLLKGREDVGPISDVEFLALVTQGQIVASDEVKSPEFTKDIWVDVSRINLTLVSERIDQRNAERRRRTNAQIRRQKADEKNRAKLSRGIRSAIQSGSLSSGHRQAIEKFALAAGIPAEEVQATIATQSNEVIREVFEEALEDGILDPQEEQQISQLAISLGVALQFSKEDAYRISLCRLAYELDSGGFVPTDVATAPFKLTAKEQLLAETHVHWNEIVTLKRPTGIPLGGNTYLKQIGTGVAYLTTKQVSMIGDFQSKKFTLSSVQRVTRFSDGVLFNRSSGKSVFLEMPMREESTARFALIAENYCSGEPVLGQSPSTTFIPEVIDAQLAKESASTDGSYKTTLAPRYTFRVVGEFVGNREANIRCLRIGEPLVLLREPDNEFDPNAVAVYNSSLDELGYLKRDVAAWFAPVLSRNPASEAFVHAFSSTGALIVGVYF